MLSPGGRATRKARHSSMSRKDRRTPAADRSHLDQPVDDAEPVPNCWEACTRTCMARNIAHQVCSST
jgi:hypothetical protein